MNGICIPISTVAFPNTTFIARDVKELSTAIQLSWPLQTIQTKPVSNHVCHLGFVVLSWVQSLRNDTSFNIPSMRSFRNMSSSGPILVLCLCLFVSMFNVLVSCGLHDTLRPAFTDNRRLPPRIFTSRMKKQITYSNDKRPMDQPGGLRISKDKVRSRMDRMPRMCCSGM